MYALCLRIPFLWVYCITSLCILSSDVRILLFSLYICRQGSFDEVTREREFLSIICLFTPTPLPLGRESNEF